MSFLVRSRPVGRERHGKAITHVTTRVTRGPDGLRISGRRFYSTGALFAHWIPTRALDAEDRPLQAWVRRDAPGVTVIDDWAGFGQRTTASGSVIFEDAPVEEVLARAGRVLDRVSAAPVTAERAAEASVAVAEAKILTTEVALAASERLLELAGASATRAAANLGRFWRDARVHTLHDPVRWKYHLLGAYTLNGALPARHQWN